MLVDYATLTKLLGTVVLTLTTHSEGGNEEPMGRWAGEETNLQGQRDLCQASQRAGEEPGLDLLRQSLGLGLFVGAGCVCVGGRVARPSSPTP